MRIDLGCGNNKKIGCIGIDSRKLSQADIIADIDKYGIPFKDNSISYVHVSHFLEHIHKLRFVINEIYRICKNNSIVNIIVPHFTMGTSCEFHVRNFRYDSFNGYEIGRSSCNTPYFKCLKRELIFKHPYNFFNKIFNKYPNMYEQSFIHSLIFCSEVHIIFKAVKEEI